MENQKKGELVSAYHQFPHEEVMQALKLESDSLEAPIKRQVDTFNRVYYEKCYDGILTDEEMMQLNDMSLKIAQQIKDHYNPGDDSGSGIVLGVLGSIVVGFLGYLGIKKITKL